MEMYSCVHWWHHWSEHIKAVRWYSLWTLLHLMLRFWFCTENSGKFRFKDEFFWPCLVRKWPWLLFTSYFISRLLLTDTFDLSVTKQNESQICIHTRLISICFYGPLYVNSVTLKQWKPVQQEEPERTGSPTPRFSSWKRTAFWSLRSTTVCSSVTSLTYTTENRRAWRSMIHVTFITPASIVP